VTGFRPAICASLPPTTPTPAVPPSAFWNGFKLHVSESCTDAPEKERTAPNLITNVATTASTVPDTKALNGIHQ
jgi:hypothetical protein